MASLHRSEINGSEMPKAKPTSIAQLARSAVQYADSGEEHAVIKRLLEAWKDQSESLIKAEDERYETVTLVQWSALEEIEKVLARFGIPFYWDE